MSRLPFIGPHSVSELRRIRNKVDSIRGDGVTNHPDKITIASVRGAGSSDNKLRQGFWAIIQSSTRDGSNWRWFYKVREAYKSATGYGAGKWVQIEATDLDAFNATEMNNGTSGRLGNGVNVADLGTCVVQPCPNGTPVWVRFVGVADTTELQFEFANGVSKT
jgi:hypothetical protein